MSSFPIPATSNSHIEIKNACFIVDGQSIPLISGEIQYWRTLREYWEPVILRAKELGLNVISSYTPWVYHEIDTATYDFTGETSPQRDLLTFIDLLHQHEMYFIARPGPYIYGSEKNGGVPDRAAKYDRLAPEFLDMTQHYLEHFTQAVASRQITRGGNIILCQADNEPYPPLESFGTESGCFEEDGLFKQWIREKYQGDLQALNRRWQTSYTSFQEACVYFHEAYVDRNKAMADHLFKDSSTFNRYADTHEFMGWYAKDIVARVQNNLSSAGLEIPCFANGWSPLYQDFQQFSEIVPLTGIDVYPSPYFNGPSDVNDDWFYQMDILKCQQADVPNNNIWAAEYQGGTYPISMGDLPPQHYRFANRVFMSHGLKAWNWYILTTRGNWSCSPIMEFGEKNASFDAVAGQNKLAQRVEPWHCELAYDLSLLCYKPHRVIDPAHFKNSFDELTRGNLSFEYFNPKAKSRPSTNTLLYSGGDWCDAESVENIQHFIEEGGTLITFNHMPKWLDDMSSSTQFGFIDAHGARPVNLPIDIEMGAEKLCLNHVGHLNRKVNLAFYKQPPGEPIMAQLGTSNAEHLVDIKAAVSRSFPMGYVLQRGKGKIIHFGCQVHLSLIQLAMRYLKQKPLLSTSSECCLANVHQHSQGHLELYVINRSDRDQVFQVKLDLKRFENFHGANIDIIDRDDATTSKENGSSCLAVDQREQSMMLQVSVAAHDVKLLKLQALSQ